MKLVHMSDTHLGFSAYRALDKDWGINQREADVARAFCQAIDKVLEIKPALLVHTGDLFDSVRPSNRSISTALEQILRVSKAGIPSVIIAGNHSTPKMQDTGSIFRLLDLFDGVYPVYSGRYDSHAFGELRVHAIPQCPTKDGFRRELDTLLSDGDFSSNLNVLLLHSGVEGIREFSMGDFNEQAIPLDALKPPDPGGEKPGFNYIGLGHYHSFAKVSENTYFCGSTERFSFSEAGSEKGIVEVDIAKEETKVKFLPLRIRDMVDIPPLDAAGMPAEEIADAVEDLVKQAQPAGKITRLKIDNLPDAVRNTLDFHRIRAQAADAIQFEIGYGQTGDEDAIEPPVGDRIGSLASEFASFIAECDLGDEADKLRKLGLDYLERTTE